ncbi:MAG TPA: serine/threonine protein kinase, partial [Myxococcaceae bacterium]|nr:serine/threonine protein kinase [Myxococcaceae bacterium]
MPGRSQRQFGNYEVVLLVGSGELAEVFRARVMRGRQSGQTAALKRLQNKLAQHERCVRAFTDGMEAASGLDH